MTKQIHGEYAKFEIGERVLVKMGALDSHLIERNPWAGSKVALCNMLYGVSSDNFTIVEGEPMPISDTPETDALLDPLRGSAAFNGPTAELARKLERERDKALKSISEIRDSLTELGSPSWPPPKGWLKQRLEACHECGGCGMIPGTKPNDDVMNTPCPKCNVRKPDAFRDALTAIEERYTDGSDTHEDWQFMGETARKALEAQP